MLPSDEVQRQARLYPYDEIPDRPHLHAMQMVICGLCFAAMAAVGAHIVTTSGQKHAAYRLDPTLSCGAC